MTDIPESPREFITQFLPAQFGLVKAAVAGKSSSGSLVLRVSGAGEWSLRLSGGELVVEDGAAQDAILQITVSQDDFVPVFVEIARAQASKPQTPEKQLFAFKALTIDADRAKLVRSILGSLAFVVKDGDLARRVVLTPGVKAPRIEDADCKIECTREDFDQVQAGKALPMQLIMSGKMRITGNAQIAMALSTLFV